MNASTGLHVRNLQEVFELTESTEIKEKHISCLRLHENDWNISTDHCLQRSADDTLKVTVVLHSLGIRREISNIGQKSTHKFQKKKNQTNQWLNQKNLHISKVLISRSSYFPLWSVYLTTSFSAIKCKKLNFQFSTKIESLKNFGTSSTCWSWCHSCWNKHKIAIISYLSQDQNIYNQILCSGLSPIDKKVNSVSNLWPNLKC